MGLLIDASVVVAMERRRLTMADLAVAVPPEPIAISVLTAGELLVGVERADTDARRRQRSIFLETLIGAVPLVDVDLAAARAFGRLQAAILVAGTSIGAIDLLLAAQATARNDGVLTENGRDFERVPGLRVVAPDWTAVAGKGGQ
ncbi:MAG TPA: PIN domain-containing protein [Thermomicrobiales bacterium]|nr:PIN domain-containing protein [Thermomicrobiales bacterium]